MPLPMVHLGISHNLIAKLNPNDVALFYLGTIAPDAVHIRKVFKREDKNISHLYNTDMEVWRKNAKELMMNCQVKCATSCRKT